WCWWFGWSPAGVHRPVASRQGRRRNHRPIGTRQNNQTAQNENEIATHPMDGWARQIMVGLDVKLAIQTTTVHVAVDPVDQLVLLFSAIRRTLAGAMLFGLQINFVVLS